MKVASLVVGAVIGGAVWVYALRATSAAKRDTAGSPSESPPPPDPGGVVRDGQGNIVSTVGMSPPIIAPPASTPCNTTSNLADIAHSATDQTVVSVNATVAGTDGNTGSVLPVKTDPINKTIAIDTEHPAGGQGTDQMSATATGQSPPIVPSPSYADAMPAYTDYLAARYGTTAGMTDQQINAALQEAAAVGGLPL